jgi:hypothetical protein
VRNLDIVIESGATIAPVLRGGDLWSHTFGVPRGCEQCHQTFFALGDTASSSDLRGWQT